MPTVNNFVKRVEFILGILTTVKKKEMKKKEKEKQYF